MEFAVPFSLPLIALRTLEGQVYQADSTLLLQHSGLFRTVLSLPQPIHGPDKYIDTWEKASTVRRILSMMHKKPVKPWKSFHDFSSVLELAEKWDCPSILNQLRQSLSEFISDYPLQTFSIARSLGWDNEARHASSASLALDFKNSINAGVLASMYTADVTALHSLRIKRCVIFKQLLDSPHRFPSGNGSMFYCDPCDRFYPQDGLWAEFKRVLVDELKKNPCGTTVLSLKNNEITTVSIDPGPGRVDGILTSLSSDDENRVGIVGYTFVPWCYVIVSNQEGRLPKREGFRFEEIVRPEDANAASKPPVRLTSDDKTLGTQNACFLSAMNGNFQAIRILRASQRGEFGASLIPTAIRYAQSANTMLFDLWKTEHDAYTITSHQNNEPC
ncbi:hypothetical protein CC2G_008166 [Coprinopsis cinerea AmutBmut pab1-1]|nr:hypothetical protein CC2G_008166 [Coprinopsis cinerea AmutBmut pab1-1]